MTLQGALEALYGLERRKNKLGLDGTRLLLAALGNPERRFRAVHVAGTNGKGTVCAIVERVLRAAGHRTGLFTSPHLVDFRERIRVDGRWADESRLQEMLRRIEDLPGAGERTFFEVVTALGFSYFAAENVEWAVVEVGLGGRLDTTNVITPEVSVITSIGLDHAEILGNTVREIAFEKAGIVKAGVPVVSGVAGADDAAVSATEVIATVACERAAELVIATQRVAVMPAGAVRSKVDACLGYGARVVLHGDDLGETFAEMERIRDEQGLTFVHPFDDPAVIAGHGSIGLELVDDLPDVDVVVVGVGGGGLICGVAAAVKGRKPGVRVVGVEPARSNALSLAMERGEVVTIQPHSVADGLGAPFVGAWTLAMARRYLDGIVLLDDSTILAGMRFAVERLKQVLEPAGAAALAAVLAGRVALRNGDRVAVVLSGGNVDVGRLGEFLAAAGPLPGDPT